MSLRDHRKKGNKKEFSPSYGDEGGFGFTDLGEGIRNGLMNPLSKKDRKKVEKLQQKRRKEEEKERKRREKERQNQASSFGGSRKGGNRMYRRREYSPEERERFRRTDRVVKAARAIVELGKDPEKNPKYKERKAELDEALKAQGTVGKKLSRETRDMLERYLAGRVMRFEEEVDVVFQIHYWIALCQKRFRDALKAIMAHDQNLVRKHEIKESVSKLNAIKIVAALEEAGDKVALDRFLNEKGVPEVWKRVIRFKRFVERLQKNHPDLVKEREITTFLDDRNVVKLVGLIKNELRDLTLLARFKQILPKEMRLLEPEPEKKVEPAVKVKETEEPVDVKVADLGLSPKAVNSLTKAGINTVSEAKKTGKEKLLALSDVGKKTVEKLLK